ncbi:piwi-like protein 3 [Erethizon dorsatum]
MPFAEQLPLTARLQALSVRSRNPAGIFQDLVVRTRESLEHVKHSKTGSEGRVIELLTNHFQVTYPQWIAYKYNIDYKPDIKDVDLREKLLFQHESTLGRHRMFDGNSLLLPRRLQHSNMELVSRTRDHGIVKITVQFSKELGPTHPDYLRYYNIFFRRILKLMNFKQIGRNYYDGNSRENFCDNRLEAWRGYVTSILPYEHSLTLCSDICHKLLRLETTYDIIMKRCEKIPKDKYLQEEISKELIGLIVFTRYNNKTYRVDAVDWDQSPRDTFKKSDGSEITFAEYYMQQYNQIITDLSQPLLVSQGRWRKGQNTPREPVLLVPQLCYPTDCSITLIDFSLLVLYVEMVLRVSHLLAFKVVCILPDSEKYRYDEIKKFLCIRCPVPSQCVVAETLVSGSALLTITTKIAQQMNCKMGGALWKVETGLQKTMFIGIDCFHDIINRQKSIAGFVASTNEELTKWHSQCVFQEPGQELVDGLNSCLEAALDSWFKNVQHQPDSVVVYRDGVGDGQLQALLDHEIPQLVSHLRKHQVKLTFIVVKKRINTRFFVQSQERLQNPPSGTVIDVALTREEWYDFYIVSQSSKHGTVTPTHYNVIYDTVRLDPDTVQRLTYKLCHMYYNFPGTIRVPAPCHYAHKLAYFVGQNIQQEPHNSLSNCLYYL